MNFEEKLACLPLCDRAADTARSAYIKLAEKREFHALRKRVENLERFGDIDLGCTALAEKSGVWVNHVRFALLVECLDVMRGNYTDEALFLDAAADICIKAQECLDVYGDYGIWPFFWYEGYYRGERFQFGRLQFELIDAPHDMPGYGVKMGERVINIHIPSGSPLPSEAVDAALAQAKEFFAGQAERFVCESWLLFPPYREVFGAGSNTYKFTDRFEILEVGHQKSFEDAWRVFSVEEIRDVRELPRDTSMRRAFLRHIESGGGFGFAFGVMKE